MLGGLGGDLGFRVELKSMPVLKGRLMIGLVMHGAAKMG